MRSRRLPLGPALPGWWFLLSFLICAAGVAAIAADWPQWRGPNRDGKVPSFVAPAKWPEKLSLQWSVKTGRGDSSPVLVGERLFIFSRENDKETLVALSAKDGSPIWRHEYPQPFDSCLYNDELGRYVQADTIGGAPTGPTKNPKATPTVWKNRIVYTFGVAGALSAINASNGEVIWHKPGPKAQGAPMVGTALSPLLDNNLVIVHLPGAQRAIKCKQWEDQFDARGGLVAYDALTGAEKWKWTGDGASYASPIIGTFAGTRQIISITEKRIVGLDAATAKLLWEQQVKSPDDQNIASPLVHGDMVIYGAMENPVTALRPVKTGNTWTTEKVWENAENGVFLSTPVLVDDVLYGFSYKLKGHFFAIDATTGKTLWMGPGREGDNASLLYAGGVLVMLLDDAELIVAKPSRTAFEVVRRYTVGTSSTYSHPVLDGKRIFVREVDKLNAWTLP